MAVVSLAASAAAPRVDAPGPPARPPSAAQRVFAVPELVDLIVDHVPLNPRTPLPELNRAFGASCSRPQVWAARTAPSTIDWAHHAVHTERCMTLHKVAALQRPITWHHAGEMWRLHYTRRRPTAGDEGTLDWVWYQSRRRMRPYLAAHPLSNALWRTPNGLPLYFEDVYVRQCVTLSFLEQRWERKQGRVALLEPALCGWWALTEVTNTLLGALVVPSFAGGFILEQRRRGVSETWTVLEALACCVWLFFGLRQVREEYRRYSSAQSLFEALTESLGGMPQLSPAFYKPPRFASLDPTPTDGGNVGDVA